MAFVVVLPETTRRDDVDDAIGAMELCLVNLVPRTDSQPRQVVATSQDGRRAATFVEDARLAIAYAVVDGADADALAGAIAARLGSVSYAEIEAKASGDAADVSWALRHVIAFQDAARAARIIVAGLSHPDASVRRVAAIAGAYAPSDEVAKAAGDVLANETDERVRPLLRAITRVEGA